MESQSSKHFGLDPEACVMESVVLLAEKQAGINGAALFMK